MADTENFEDIENSIKSNNHFLVIFFFLLCWYWGRRLNLVFWEQMYTDFTRHLTHFLTNRVSSNISFSFTETIVRTFLEFSFFSGTTVEHSLHKIVLDKYKKLLSHFILFSCLSIFPTNLTLFFVCQYPTPSKLQTMTSKLNTRFYFVNLIIFIFYCAYFFWITYIFCFCHLSGQNTIHAHMNEVWLKGTAHFKRP